MTHAKLIDLLGGQASLARRLGRHKSSLCRWARDGIPPPHYPVFLRLCEQAGVTMTLEKLADASPRFGRHGWARTKLPVRVAA